jgi:phosphate starvation-inducible protein PhoH and related proteins
VFYGKRDESRSHEKMETTRQITLDSNELAQSLFGEHHRNLKRIERLSEVGIRTRGNVVDILGPEAGVRMAERLIRELYRLVKRGYCLREEDVESAQRLLAGDPDLRLDQVYKNGVAVGPRKSVTPKSLAQKHYLAAIEDNDITFAIGPAGTGKTYLAMAMAVSALVRSEVGRIILTRPAVEAGERLGFLPGDLVEKVSPYLRPLYDALYDMMDFERAGTLTDQGVIEVAPLAFMRGRSLNNAFVILDEAQNTTRAQMKMFLTRLGADSKAVVTGDVTQIDLPAGEISGLKHARLILAGIAGISFVEFTDKDVVRHPLVMEIIKAYERETSSEADGPAEGKNDPQR